MAGLRLPERLLLCTQSSSDDSIDCISVAEVGQNKAILHALRPSLEKWQLSFLAMMALGLRLYKLEQESLSLDEIGQVLVAKSSTWWETVLRSAQHYGNTPLDYLVTHFTLHVGQSEGILRLPAVMWGGLSVVAVYLIGRDMFDKPTGYLAAFLLAITPLHVYYSREVRFYSLATFLTLLSLHAFTRAIGSNTPRSWITYAVIHSLALYAHYYVLIITALLGVWLLWGAYTKRYVRTTVIAFFSTVGFALSLFLPWLYYDIRYEQVYKHGFLNTGFGFRSPSPVSLLGGLFFFQNTSPSFTNPSTWWVGLIMVTALLGIAIILRQHSGLHFMDLLVLLLLGGVSSVLILDYLTAYFFAPRQLVLYAPVLLLIASAGYLSLIRLVCCRFTRHLWVNKADTLAVVLFVLFSLWALWQPLTGVYSRHREDWRGTARYLMRHLRSDDVLVTPTPRHISFYAPELSAQMERLKDVSSLLEIAQLHGCVWILGTNYILRKRYPDVYRWIQEEHALDVSLDSRLRLYLYSLNTPSHCRDPDAANHH